MKLTDANYFSKKASKEFMSVSQWKAFNKCPASALAEIKGKYEREKSTALLVGSYVDSFFEGTLPKFIRENPEIFKRDGSLKSEYIQAEAIIQRIQKDKLFMEYLSGEKQVIMTGEINDVKIKIKIDSYHPDKIVDLKIMRDFESVYSPESGRQPWFEAWGYDIQGAVYQEIVRQNTGEKLPFFLATATKEKVTDLDIVHIDQKMLDYALERFKQNLEYFDAVKKGVIEPVRCEKCEYCKQTKVLKEPTEAEELYLDV
jgi:hypothetical protein